MLMLLVSDEEEEERRYKITVYVKRYREAGERYTAPSGASAALGGHPGEERIGEDGEIKRCNMDTPLGGDAARLGCPLHPRH